VYRPAAGQAWRNEAGAYIRSFENLNRSQQEAVAKAILRRFTLWQVSCQSNKKFLEVLLIIGHIIFLTSFVFYNDCSNTEKVHLAPGQLAMQTCYCIVAFMQLLIKQPAKHLVTSPGMTCNCVWLVGGIQINISVELSQVFRYKGAADHTCWLL